MTAPTRFATEIAPIIAKSSTAFEKAVADGWKAPPREALVPTPRQLFWNKVWPQLDIFEAEVIASFAPQHEYKARQLLELVRRQHALYPDGSLSPEDDRQLAELQICKEYDRIDWPRYMRLLRDQAYAKGIDVPDESFFEPLDYDTTPPISPRS